MIQSVGMSDIQFTDARNASDFHKVLKIKSRLFNLDNSEIFENQVAQSVIVNLPWVKE
jgi:hypothetical protein